MTRRLVALGVVAVLVAGLPACTGVPSNSSPQIVVNRIGVASQGGGPTISPPKDADPRTIVSGFLDAAASEDPRTATRAFLTPEARTKWQDTTVTVLAGIKIGNPQNGSVSVSGRPVGTVSTAGVYRSSLGGDATATPVTFSFTMKQIAGQWRIDALPPGVLISSNDFDRLYSAKQLYFYDLSEQHLVPDPRYTALVDTTQLATWLVAQLVSGPRAELQNAVTTEFPAQIDPTHVTVTVGSTTTIELPGARQLDAATRNRLAAQLALTLVQVPVINELSILDTGGPVVIPQAGGTRFAAGVFQGALAPAIVNPTLYYLRGGAVVDQSGRALPGPIGTGSYALSSAALTSSGTTDLRVAGVSGSGSAAQLMVGSVASGLRRVGVVGRLSRPAWAPGMDEVWIGVARSRGPTVVRVSGNAAPVAVPITTTNGPLTGTVTALRLSPEGSRIALVITQPDNSAQAWIGSVVRTAAQVRIDSLEPITPSGVAIRDVAWNDPLKLFVIGRTLTSGDTDVYEVQVDGSRWNAGSVTNLPGNPDAITVAQNQAAWVSDSGTVWVQRAGSWASPGLGGTAGTNPIYLE